MAFKIDKLKIKHKNSELNWTELNWTRTKTRLLLYPKKILETGQKGEIHWKYARINFLYQNSGNSNNWIKIKLIGETSNRSVIGAKVKITKGTKTQYRYISSLTDFNRQNELTVIIGLGLSTIIDEIGK